MDEFIPEKTPSRRDMWSIAFVANLALPLFFGWMVTYEGGRIGMVAGVGLLWYLGYRICGASDACGRALVIGAIPVAAAQLCPILHIFAGITSVGVADAVCHGSFANTGIKTELGGFIATLSMGVMMIGVAAVIGTIGSLLFPRRPRERLVAGSHLYDRYLDG
jgi:hypothetical protein